MNSLATAASIARLVAAASPEEEAEVAPPLEAGDDDAAVVPSRVPSNGASQKAIMGTSLFSTDAAIGRGFGFDTLGLARGIFSTAGGVYMIEAPVGCRLVPGSEAEIVLGWKA